MNMDIDKDDISLQPSINLGMIGAVSNGKSSVTEQLTGTKTQKYAAEKERNITIKLGYANAKIYKCRTCEKPKCFQSVQSEVFSLDCKHCDAPMDLVKHISLVDSPGHNQLMATMLNGTSIMDYSILVESASNTSMGSQSLEHIKATNLIGLKNKIVCLNKMDLIKKELAIPKITLLKEYLSTFEITTNSPIVPIAANYGINIDVLCQYICDIEEPKRDLTSSLKMIIVRSFNVNKQEIDIEQLQGGVIGGSIVRGKLTTDMIITIYPGVIGKVDNGLTKWSYSPLTAKVLSINSEKNNLTFAKPGGLIGVQLNIDPGLTVKDGLVGNLITESGQKDITFKVFETIYCEFTLLDQLIDLKANLSIIVNCNANNSKATIVKVKKNKMEISLVDGPICLEIGDFITISQQFEKNMIVIGRGKVVDGLSSSLF
ncbi:MAG: eukaryotic translation initiation factor 2 gamma subunit [Barrevirus sp.]|uniref:protein-synthesizing GTPase n=1 Tax=Barrevirus sp. TaxID=2487763 RepID=A0A3G4ZTX4_9VIRU|nr:MAG: eukaryotic translation initiation factor 2 gamma subunit [Barrevirus sp.]